MSIINLHENWRKWLLELQLTPKSLWLMIFENWRKAVFGVASFDLLSEIFDLWWPLVTLKATFSENSRKELPSIWTFPTLIMVEIWLSSVNVWTRVTFDDRQTTFIYKAYGKRIILIKNLALSNKIRNFTFSRNFRLERFF